MSLMPLLFIQRKPYYRHSWNGRFVTTEASTRFAPITSRKVLSGRGHVQRRETRVALVRSTYKNVYDRLNKILEYLEYAPKKENIFIKPNLVGSYAPNTDILRILLFVEALVRIFRERYPRSEIVVGDGCAVMITGRNVLEKSKYRSFADRYGVRLVSLDELPRKKFSWGARRTRSPRVAGNP